MLLLLVVVVVVLSFWKEIITLSTDFVHVNLLDITSKFCSVAVFVIVDF